MNVKKLAKGILCFCLALFSTMAYAQNKEVTGKVTDSKDGSPVSGISVLGVTSSGKKVGTATANDGTFKLSSVDGISKITLSGVGFEKQELSVSGKSEVAVSMKSSNTSLNEVTVVGYGTLKKREITSAITRVNAEQFNKGNINDVAQLLQGKVAGLSISRAGGDVNGGFDIRLRGLSTIGAGTSPLVVIDGQVGADLNSVDPNDIKSIDVLKDGSSAAIYGTRGSAGVIIVTTKTGVKGTSQVTYNGSVSAESAARLTPHMNAAQYRATIKALRAGVDYGANTDWYKEITRTAISHQHNLSFSGGNEHTTYNASVNYRDAQGVAITTGLKQLNGRLNITHKALNDRLVFNVEVSTTRKTAELGFNNAFEYATIYNPTSPVYAQKPEQDLAGGGYFEVSATEYSNPVAVLKQNTNHQQLSRLNFAGSAEYEIIKGLKFLTRYAQQQTSTYLSAYSPSTAFIDRGFQGGTGVGRHGISYKRDDEAVTQLYENTLSYNGKISNLEVAAVAGYSYQDFIYQGFSANAGNFITDLSGQDFSTAQDVQNGQATVNSYKNGNRLVAFFGRLNLNYNNFAFLSASLRREGSSQFGPNNKWGYFPAVSAGIDLNKFLNLPGFNTLKLRGSYGVTGALPPQSGLSSLTYSGQGNYLINGAWIATYGPNQNVNPDLKWERKAETDIGLDFAAFNNRLTGTADYYNRKTTDLIFNVTVPSPPALFNRAWKNIGDLTGKGFEIALNYEVIKKSNKFNWTTGVNFAHNRVVLTRLDASAGSYIGETNLGSPGQEATQITRTYAGAEIGAFYQAVFKGINDTGYYMLDDGTGKAVLASKSNYKTVIGHGLPKFELGWTNTFNYGNFDLNFFLRGSFGHDLINTNRAFYETPQIASLYNVVNSKYYNPNIRDAKQLFSSLFVEKGDFVKLDNATLGYNFNISKKPGGVKSFRAFITGHNLFTITGYTGADPEVRYVDNLNGNILAPGIDRRSTWVLTRSFTFGVNVGL